MGLHPEGMQPFRPGDSYLVCNGEIYGFEALRADLAAKGYAFAGIPGEIPEAGASAPRLRRTPGGSVHLGELPGGPGAQYWKKYLM